jgi:dye decolorizing peroxidase
MDGHDDDARNEREGRSGRVTRRNFVLAATAATLGGGIAALIDRLVTGGGGSAVGAQPSGLPARQHAWDAVLARDGHGNAVAPRHVRLLLFDVAGRPAADSVRTVEAALRTLERRFPWGPGGLLFTLAWGPRYFERTLGVKSPVPHPEALSSFELPALDAYDACLHLACDDEARIDAVTAALVHGGMLAGADGPLDLRPALTLRETRTGFVGARLPAAHQDVTGIPSGHPVPKSAPLYMGFKSGFTKNQASEDDVTIASGPLAGGTTMHVSRMRLRLESWYGLLSDEERVARMYAPQVTQAQVDRFTNDAPSQPGKLAQAATRYGVVGHSQASAVARRKGRAIILRRDFDTTDGGEAGLHFVALQRSIADFVTTRKAMNADRATTLNPAITPTVNNGINEFIFVTHRANYVVPPRAQRAFPLLPGREAALRA